MASFISSECKNYDECAKLYFSCVQIALGKFYSIKLSN